MIMDRPEQSYEVQVLQPGSLLNILFVFFPETRIGGGLTTIGGGLFSITTDQTRGAFVEG